MKSIRRIKRRVLGSKVNAGVSLGTRSGSASASWKPPLARRRIRLRRRLY